VGVGWTSIGALSEVWLGGRRDTVSGSDWGEHLHTTGTGPHTTLDLTHVRHSRLTPGTPPKPGERSTSATESLVVKSAGALQLQNGGGTWGTALYTVRGVGSGSRNVDVWRVNVSVR
jgi:hypothetical protein